MKRTDWQALIATEVDRQVDENIASRILTATKETFIDANEVGTSAIDLCNQTPLTNLVDAALLKAVENRLLDYALEERIRNTTESEMFMDVIVDEK